MSVCRMLALGLVIGAMGFSSSFAQLPPNAPVLKQKVDAPPAAQKAADKAKAAVDDAAKKAGDAAKAVEKKAAPPKTPLNDPMTPPVDVAGLPRVLLIGDSISIGYTVPVRKLLEGKANVHRPLTNCGPTKNGTKNLGRG
ncbi:MAG: hypothetical protein QM811_21070 [Pirellulales bacterium]